ncbi:transglycosylase SLT domain-containing protein [Rouxiella badensis]|uniref:transglycosylase SLT domain-containing protein n=1 Tax=Rouxiella badensis TaxID=1646377 RepID=UPI001D15A893|nr:transglycosylase SLT domain-containing protein [Rouxiella badensis]MCC3701656.1 transglycosylase SLT domain-containing protein [Rouxiella badensis]
MARSVLLILLPIITGYLLLPIASAAYSLPTGYRQVAMIYGVPPELLYVVALNESSALLTAGRLPWPWTINVAGKGYHYATRLEAWSALNNFLKSHPRKRIDVGISQINLGWNGHHFNSTWDAFDPYLNLKAAAVILRACYSRNPGSWLNAAGCFHRPAGGLASKSYKTRVNNNLIILYAGHLEVSDASIKHGYSWIEPKRKER